LAAPVNVIAIRSSARGNSLLAKPAGGNLFGQQT
jgi:hypothetical protein